MQYDEIMQATMLLCCYFNKNEVKNYFLLTFRNELITDSILKDQNKKIAILYGAKHFDGILENLQKTDKNYKEVEKL